MGSCFSSPEKKSSAVPASEGLQRTTSSYQGSTADATRYSDRPHPSAEGPPTASQLAKTTTLEQRVKQAEAQNRARAG